MTFENSITIDVKPDKLAKQKEPYLYFNIIRLLIVKWRRGRDLNPRGRKALRAFQARPLATRTPLLIACLQKNFA